MTETSEEQYYREMADEEHRAMDALTEATALAEEDDIREQCQEFAREHPTPNVQRAIDYAEAGILEWEEVYDMFKKALVATMVKDTK